MDMERTKHEFIWIIIVFFLSEISMDINGKLTTFNYILFCLKDNKNVSQFNFFRHS